MTRGLTRTLVAVAACLLAAACLAQDAEPIGPELLTNGSFEQLGEADGPVGWSGFSSPDWGDCDGRLRLSTEHAHSGDRALEMLAVRQQYAAGHEERISVHPDVAYVLSAWVRTELARGQSAYLVASWFSEERWLSLTRSRAVRGRQPWTHVSVVLPPERRPEGAVEVMITFRVSGTSAAGRAWVDDMSMREAELAPPTDGLEAQSRRLIDMTRELLIERDRWAARLEVLRQRRADLSRLLAAEGDFQALRERWGADVAHRRFLTHREPPRATFERSAPMDAEQVREQASRIAELPRLRQQCYRELDGILALKRRLDERPELRRFYLWARLAAMRREGSPPAAAARAQPTPEFLAASEAPPEQRTGELLDLTVRVHLQDDYQAGSVAVRASLDREAVVQAGLFAPAGEIVAFGTTEPEDAEIALTLTVTDPLLWFPDCRRLHTLRVGVFDEGEASDWVEQRVAFRRIEIVESDVSATMRHAWAWAPADYTVAVNGQPYFLRGTRCGHVREFPERAAELFDELWLDYQRTYGSFVDGLSPQDANALAERGFGYIGSLCPDYDSVRSYQSMREGFEPFREAVEYSRWAVDHPLLIGMEVGNEAELAAWGADLPAVYGDDLWHVFNEVTGIVRQTLQPQIPVAYVRAARFHNVRPVPRCDYHGVNQYTGRYWGRRCTIAPDLAKLAFAATCDNAPLGITEWNGPKYSWATRGVSGVDEEGAAAYIFDYFRQMTRTPAIVLSTEFVLNWVVTPLEDLTTVSLQEGLARRDEWRWTLQKGVPWYPHIWPDLLTDTACRRTMQGFQSPMFDLCRTPGEIVVGATQRHIDEARRLAEILRGLGRSATAQAMPSAGELASRDASWLLIGGYGGGQPEAVRALEEMRVIGRTTAASPAAGGYFIQRRVNPHFPDRFLVVLTAADEAGMARGLDRLRASAEGLREAYDRHADRRRILAVVDDSQQAARVFSRYVAELPTRSVMVSRDDVRTRLDPGELLDDNGTPAGPWNELAAVIIATRRALDEGEVRALDALRRAGATVVWSAGALAANEAAPAVGLGDERSMAEHLPVAEWIRTPLAVPDAGDVSVDRIMRFTGWGADAESLQRALAIHEIRLPPGWRAAVSTEDGAPVVAASPDARDWAFGCDLSAAAQALWSTTQQGDLHAIYDRDTACGLERIFRVLTNAAAQGLEDRPASTPRLRAEVMTDRILYAPEETALVTVRVRDADGLPAGAHVRVTLADGERLLGLPGEDFAWATAQRVGEGLYVTSVPLADGAPRPATVDIRRVDHRGQRVVTVLAEATREGFVGDWNAAVARVGLDSDEDERMQRLAALVESRRVELPLSVSDEQHWVEMDALARLPATIRPGEPLPLEVAVTRVEDERGDDEMRDVALVLRAEDGREVVLPLAPDRILTGIDSPRLADAPDEYIGVSSTQPAVMATQWPDPQPGRWTMFLRYVYTDHYRMADGESVTREDRFPAGVFVVPGR
ncbi:MAG: hypothetical protein ACP5KN_00470 [Armatimonadota bacterium]